eukprot:XP_020404617.1 vegetative cell wall protein gp1-like [Zea mays]
MILGASGGAAPRRMTDGGAPLETSDDDAPEAGGQAVTVLPKRASGGGVTSDFGSCAYKLCSVTLNGRCGTNKIDGIPARLWQRYVRPNDFRVDLRPIVPSCSPPSQRAAHRAADRVLAFDLITAAGSSLPTPATTPAPAHAATTTPHPRLPVVKAPPRLTPRNPLAPARDAPTPVVPPGGPCSRRRSWPVPAAGITLSHDLRPPAIVRPQIASPVSLSTHASTPVRPLPSPDLVSSNVGTSRSKPFPPLPRPNAPRSLGGSAMAPFALGSQVVAAASVPVGLDSSVKGAALKTKFTDEPVQVYEIIY